jgi:hypothetical protein
MKKIWKRTLIGASATGVLAFGLIGFAHTKAGRPLLGLLRGAPGCPVQEARPAEVEAYRTARLRERVGTTAAQGHPALAFELGVSKKADVQRWMMANGASCKPDRKDSVLRCDGVPLEKGAKVSDAYLQFDAEDRLVALDVFRTVSPVEAATLLTARTAALENSVGPATRRLGTVSSAVLSKPLQRAAVEFRYSRYTAELSAMNYGKSGVQIREQYQWLPG